MSDSDSDSSSSSDSEQEQVKATPVKTVVEDDSSDDSSDSSDEAPAKKTKGKKVQAKKEEDSDDSSDDSSDDEADEPVKKTVVTKEDDSDSDSDSSDDSDDEKEATKTPVVAAKKDDSDSSDSDSDSDDEKEEKADVEMKEVEEKKFKPMKSSGPVTILFDWNLNPSAKLSNPRKRKLENASSKPAKKKVVASKKAEKKVEAAEVVEEKAAAPASGDFKPTKDFNPDDFRSAELKDKTCNVFVKGISTNAFQADVEAFFTEMVAKPVSVRHKWEEGRSGLAWVVFATPEQASKAVIDCNNEYIKDRWVNTDWSEERKNNNSSNNRGPRNAHLKGTTNRIWIGNLHREVQRDTLTELFAEKGVTTDVFIIGRDETRPQIAYVSFETTEIADTVVEAFNGHQLMDYTMRMDWAEERKSTGRGSYKAQELAEKQPGCVTCFVGRLNDAVDDDKLKELFKDCGNIEGIRYLERDGEFKGVAFVTFEETESTDKATKLNGTEFMGKNIRVDFAADRKKEY